MSVTYTSNAIIVNEGDDIFEYDKTALEQFKGVLDKRQDAADSMRDLINNHLDAMKAVND